MDTPIDVTELFEAVQAALSADPAVRQQAETYITAAYRRQGCAVALLNIAAETQIDTGPRSYQARSETVSHRRLQRAVSAFKVLPSMHYQPRTGTCLRLHWHDNFWQDFACAMAVHLPEEHMLHGAGLRQLSAILLKQQVTYHWDEGAPCFREPELTDEEKAAVRSAILALLFQAPLVVCTPLGVGIAAIANWDFPEVWPEVLPTLLSAASADGSSAWVCSNPKTHCRMHAKSSAGHRAACREAN
jgi:Importin-beta N-terminal domain